MKHNNKIWTCKNKEGVINLSKLHSRLEKSEVKYSQISNMERCKKDFIFLINKLDEIRAETKKVTEKPKELDSRNRLITVLKSNSHEKQSLYSNNLNIFGVFKRMLEGGVAREVVFAKFFRTYPYCMPNRDFIKK